MGTAGRMVAAACAALTSVVLTAPCLASDAESHGADAEVRERDAEIQRKIEARLARLGLDRRANIRVSVQDHVPRLTGIVVRYRDSLDAEREARKEAEAVVNLVRVVPEEACFDRAIRAEAEAEILQWARYDASDAVAVEVRNCEVSLRGWVETPAKRREIEDRLSRLEGMRDLHNDLHLQGFAPGDVQLRHEIEARLYRSSIFERWAGDPDPPVRVFVDHGRVILAGTVGSRLEQVAAGQIARGTLAFAVDNQVQVEDASSRRKEDRKKDPEG